MTSSSRSQRPIWPRLVAAALLAGASAGLSGCGSMVGEALPTAVGGLPADTPAKPATPTAYPAVHNMPPSRGNTPLSADQQKQLEDDLVAARNRYGTNPDAPSTTETATPTTASTTAASTTTASTKTASATAANAKAGSAQNP